MSKRQTLGSAETLYLSAPTKACQAPGALSNFVINGIFVIGSWSLLAF
jgi:hypothetical protein